MVIFGDNVNTEEVVTTKMPCAMKVCASTTTSSILPFQESKRQRERVSKTCGHECEEISVHTARGCIKKVSCILLLHR